MSLPILAKKSLPRLIATLVKNNSGALWAPSPNNCFQESTGNTPCAVDSPVGMMLDVSKGGMNGLGAELLTDGDFSSDAGWSISQPTSGAVSISGGALSIDSINGSYAGAAQGTSPTHKYYRYTVVINSVTNGTIAVAVGGTSQLFSQAGTYTGILKTGDEVTDLIEVKRGSAGVRCTGVIESISLKELPGLHLVQATAGSKPILRGKIKNHFLNSEFLGAAAGAPGTNPSSITVSVGTGLSKEIVAVGTNADGEKYIDVRIYGTATGGDRYPYLQVRTPAAPGMTFTMSAKIALLAGDWPFYAGLEINETSSGGGYLTASFANLKTLVTGPTPVFVSHTRTLSHASCASAGGMPVSMAVADGASVDVTFRVIHPQLELGSVVNEYIPSGQFTVSSSPYGPYWLDFDGVDDFMECPVPNVGCATAVIAANQYRATPFFSFLSNTIDQADDVDYIFTTTNTGLAFETTQGNGGSLMDSNHIWKNGELTANLTLGKIQVYSADGTGKSGALEFPNGISLGRDRGLSARIMMGSIYKLALFPSILSNEKRKMIENLFLK